MNGLRATAIEELCHTLGLRTPISVAAAAEVDLRENTPAPLLNDEQLTALGVLAQPEAIAVVTRDDVVHIIATRGPWLAEHVIDGGTHHLHAADSDHAALLLLDRAGFLDAAPTVHRARSAVSVTFDAYRRMSELIRAGDCKRAHAALVAEGAPLVIVAAIVEAVAASVTEVAGLGSDGRRFIGCELTVAGTAATGRWLVPATQPGNQLSNLRVLIEPVESDALVDELSLVFGDV